MNHAFDDAARNRKFGKSRKTTKQSKTQTNKIDQRKGKKVGRKVVGRAATRANTRTKRVASAAATSKENAVNCIVKVSTRKRPRNAKICGLNSVQISRKKRKKKSSSGVGVGTNNVSKTLDLR